MINRFIDWLLNAFKPVPVTGCLLDAPEVLMDLPDHEKFGSTQFKGSFDWTPFCAPFRWQGASLMCTAYAGVEIASIFHKKENGGDGLLFSPLELFYRSGGSLFGNYVKKTFDAMHVSVVKESDVPTPYIDSWGYRKYDELKQQSHATQAQIEEGAKYALRSMASVHTNRNALRIALQDSPLSIIIKVGYGYFNATAPYWSGLSGPLHEVVLVKVEDDGRLKVKDSLTVSSSFDGFRWLAPDFPVIAAFSYIHVPTNWREVQPAQIQLFFLSNPKTGEIVPFRSKDGTDYKMWLKSGFIPMN